MNLKASLFNKSIFKTDLKRFWIASLLYTVILFFLVPFQYVAREERFYNIINKIPEDYLMTSFAGSTYPAIFFGILCGGVFALMIFMYINSTPAISFYHSLPYRRTTIYFTKLLSGFVLLATPIIINLLILLGAKASGTYIPAFYSHLFIWAYLQLAYTLIVFFGVSFVAMFTGNFMYLIAVSGICVLTPLLTIVFAEGLLSDQLYGYVGSIEQILNWVYLIPKYMLSTRAFIYLALALLFIVFGCIIYNKRDLEKNGEAIVFNKAKVFFLYLVAFLCGIFSYWYFSSLLGNSVLWMLPFGLAGIIAANMINRKQVTLKGFAKPAIIYAAAVLILFGAFKADITGFERRVPKAENVEEVFVSAPMLENNYSVRGAVYSYREYYDEQISNYSIKGTEEIEKVLALHQYKTENREASKGQAYYVNFEYKLKNGRTLKRGYTIYKFDEKGLAEDVFMLEDMKAKRYHNYKDATIKYQHISITHDFVGGELGVYLAGSEEFEELKNALHEDIKNISYEYDSTLSTDYYGGKNMKLLIAFDPKFDEEIMKMLEEKEMDILRDEKPSVEYLYEINEGYPKTMAVLEKMGLYERIPKAEDIKEMYIRHYGERITEKQITDRADIEKIYEIITTYERDYDTYEEERINIQMSTEDFGFEISLPEVKVKEVTAKYMK